MSTTGTPKGKTALSTSAATPTATRVAGSHILQASPHYATTRRHSLYGTEDRVVIDPGSRIWKVGFSGEGKPRDVFYADPVSTGSLWSLSRASDPAARAEHERLLEISIERRMRAVFHEFLLTEPKSRKVILVEQPLLPLYVKETFARVLFGNLQVPSISFAQSHLLSLLSIGRITGLVVDCGHLETTALPVFAARPLFPHLRTTPLAGARLTSHLRALLLLFGNYVPPPMSLSAPIPALSTRLTRVPEEILPDSVVEDIKTRCCFVGHILETTRNVQPSSPASTTDLPPSSDATMSDSEVSHVSEQHQNPPSSQVGTDASGDTETHLQVLAKLYVRHSHATPVQLRVVPPVTQQMGTGRGALIIPGWVRERAAEVLFEGGDIDESSVAEVILDALLKVPIDLRVTMASSILVVGGTAMLPGFIPRLHAELLRAVERSTGPSRQSPSSGAKARPPPYDRYATLRPLVPHFAIINNPTPCITPETSSRAIANAGKAPAFSPALMAWIGGSLAGALKTGGVEIPREKWDEATSSQNHDDMTDTARAEHTPKSVLPDWTRTLLPVGAPSAVAVPRPSLPPTPQTIVGA